MDRSRKWMVVAAATFGMMSAFGLSTTVAIFMRPFEAEFGWLRADIASAYALLSAGAAVGGLVAGRAVDYVNTRYVVAFGAVAGAVGLMVLSRQTELGAVQRIYLGLGVFAFACLYTPLVATVGLWFDRGRGLAVGLVTAGGTLGQGITPLLVQPLIDSFGWQHACLILGTGFILLVVPAMLLVTKPNAPVRADRGDAVLPRAKWNLPPSIGLAWLALAALFCCGSMGVPVVHLVALALDRGYEPSFAASLMLTLMLAGSVGRVAFGFIADRIGALPSYALASLVQTATIYWFASVTDGWALYALAIVFGLGFGGIMTVLNLCVRDATPQRAAGFSTALVGLFAWAGMGIGGYQGGYCFDLTGSYAVSFVGAVAAGVANLVVLAGLALHLRLHAYLAKRGAGLRPRFRGSVVLRHTRLQPLDPGALVRKPAH